MPPVFDLDDQIITQGGLNGGFAGQRIAFSVLLPVKQEEFQAIFTRSKTPPRQFWLNYLSVCILLESPVTDQSVRVDESRLNGHRRRCPAGEERLRRPEARRVIRHSNGSLQGRLRHHLRAGARRRPSPDARGRCRPWWRSAQVVLPARGEVYLHAFRIRKSGDGAIRRKLTRLSTK